MTVEMTTQKEGFRLQGKEVGCCLAMYSVDELDTVVELKDVPRPQSGDAPIIFSTEHRLVIGYDAPDEPPYPPTTAPFCVVRFNRPYFHLFRPPTHETIESHPLWGRGLCLYKALRVDRSSLVRKLERMDSACDSHYLIDFEAFQHYIFTFHDSTFECVAESFKVTVVQIGQYGEYDAVLQVFREQ
jgi:hypothetical protein